MTLNEYLRQLRKIYDNPNKFFKAVTKQQRDVFSIVMNDLAKLEVDELGNIIANQSNVTRASIIMDELNQSFWNEDYLKATEGLMDSFDQSAELTDRWMGSTFDIERMTDLTGNARAMMEVSKRNATQLLIGSSAIDASFFNPIRTQLNQGIAGGQRISELTKTLRQTIVGDKNVDGRLMSYSKQIASDAVTTADRTYSATLASEMGAEFVKYTGGILDDTRCFCIQRNGKFYHVREVQEWGMKKNLGNCRSGEGWKGMFRATDKTNIFQWLGGYNCKHSLVPVSEASVPKPDLERAIAKGYYKPDKETQEDLGIDEKEAKRKGFKEDVNPVSEGQLKRLNLQHEKYLREEMEARIRRDAYGSGNMRNMLQSIEDGDLDFNDAITMRLWTSGEFASMNGAKYAELKAKIANARAGLVRGRDVLEYVGGPVREEILDKLARLKSQYIRSQKLIAQASSNIAITDPSMMYDPKVFKFADEAYDVLATNFRVGSWKQRRFVSAFNSLERMGIEGMEGVVVRRGNDDQFFIDELLRLKGKVIKWDRFKSASYLDDPFLETTAGKFRLSEANYFIIPKKPLVNLSDISEFKVEDEVLLRPGGYMVLDVTDEGAVILKEL